MLRSSKGGVHRLGKACLKDIAAYSKKAYLKNMRHKMTYPRNLAASDTEPSTAKIRSKRACNPYEQRELILPPPNVTLGEKKKGEKQKESIPKGIWGCCDQSGDQNRKV